MTTRKYLNPAYGIIVKLADSVPATLSPSVTKRGIAAVCEATGLSPTRVYRFMLPPEDYGTGGLVPARHQQPILDYARKHGVDLGPADFFLRPETELAG